jgi:hypothetical protein
LAGCLTLVVPLAPFSCGRWALRRHRRFSEESRQRSQSGSQVLRQRAIILTLDSFINPGYRNRSSRPRVPDNDVRNATGRRHHCGASFAQNVSAAFHPVTAGFSKARTEISATCFIRVSDQAASPRQYRAQRVPIVSKANDAFFIATQRKRRNRTLPRPKKPSFRKISLHKFGDALLGTLDRIEQILQRLASFKPLILKLAGQYIGMRACRGSWICLFGGRSAKRPVTISIGEA